MGKKLLLYAWFYSHPPKNRPAPIMISEYASAIWNQELIAKHKRTVAWDNLYLEFVLTLNLIW